MDQSPSEDPVKHADNTSIAVAGIEDGTYANVKEAAAALGVPQSTLNRRLNGGLSRLEAGKKRMKLTPQEERELVQWIAQREAASNKVCYHDISERVFQLRKRRLGDWASPVSNSWVYNFLKRHRLVKARSYSPFRAVSPQKVAKDQIPHFEQEERPLVPMHDVKSEITESLSL